MMAQQSQSMAGEPSSASATSPTWDDASFFLPACINNEILKMKEIHAYMGLKISLCCVFLYFSWQNFVVDGILFPSMQFKI